MYETPLTGLVLSGGGARAAYQVGVLRALVKIRREVMGPRARMNNPFGVICGTSAGAINAAALACQADRFEASVEVLARVWQDFRAEQVYRADSLGVIRSGAQWLTMLSLGWVIARWRKARPRSLLDNEPLSRLLQRMVPLDRLQMMLQGTRILGLSLVWPLGLEGAAWGLVAASLVGALLAHGFVSRLMRMRWQVLLATCRPSAPPSTGCASTRMSWRSRARWRATARRWSRRGAWARVETSVVMRFISKFEVSYIWVLYAGIPTESLGFTA